MLKENISSLSSGEAFVLKELLKRKALCIVYQKIPKGSIFYFLSFPPFVPLRASDLDPEFLPWPAFDRLFVLKGGGERESSS